MSQREFLYIQYLDTRGVSLIYFYSISLRFFTVNYFPTTKEEGNGSRTNDFTLYY